ncbi:MAG: hypothetical protein RSA84_22555, partial [Acinetobacter sp.]
LTETPIADSLPVDVFLRFPEWCICVRTPGMLMTGEPLYGFWAMVSLDVVNNNRRIGYGYEKCELTEITGLCAA